MQKKKIDLKLCVRLRVGCTLIKMKILRSLCGTEKNDVKVQVPRRKVKKARKDEIGPEGVQSAVFSVCAFEKAICVLTAINTNNNRV